MPTQGENGNVDPTTRHTKSSLSSLIFAWRSRLPTPTQTQADRKKALSPPSPRQRLPGTTPQPSLVDHPHTARGGMLPPGGYPRRVPPHTRLPPPCQVAAPVLVGFKRIRDTLLQCLTDARFNFEFHVFLFRNPMARSESCSASPAYQLTKI